MNVLKKLRQILLIFFFFAGFFNFLCPSICLLVCIFFLSSPISPLFGSVLSFLHSVNNWPLLYTDVIDGQAGVQGVRLAGPWEALPQLSVDFWVVVQVCKMRLKSLFGCLTELSFLLYHLVPTTQSRYFSLSEIYTSAVLHRLWVTKYFGGLQSLVLYNAQAMSGCWLGYNIPPNKNMVILIS